MLDAQLKLQPRLTGGSYVQSSGKQPAREVVIAPSSAEGPEMAKADRSWEEDRAMADSPVRDVFRGQLQSSVVCSKCTTRSTTCASLLAGRGFQNATEMTWWLAVEPWPAWSASASTTPCAAGILGSCERLCQMGMPNITQCLSCRCI